MPVEVNIEDARWQALEWQALEALAERAVSGALAYLGHDPALFEVSILACDDARIQDLNAQFRGKAQPTNVLSWPSWDLSGDIPGERPEPPEPGTRQDPEPLGDLALAYETCHREADMQGKRVADHVSHLVVHSVLHLLGYDHENEPDAQLMEETEIAILASLGIANPYATFDGAPQTRAATP